MIFKAKIKCPECGGTGRSIGGVCSRCCGEKWITLGSKNDAELEKEIRSPAKHDRQVAKKQASLIWNQEEK